MQLKQKYKTRMYKVDIFGDFPHIIILVIRPVVYPSRNTDIKRDDLTCPFTSPYTY